MSAAACALVVHLAAGDASATLTELARQTQSQVLFDYNVARGNATPPLDDCFASAGEAFGALLHNTNLEWNLVTSRTFDIKARRSVPSDCPEGARVHVAAGDAIQALDELRRQADITLQFQRNAVVGERTAAVDGCYVVAQRALSGLLIGTHLTWTQVNARTFNIQRAGPSRSGSKQARHRSSVGNLIADRVPSIRPVQKVSSDFAALGVEPTARATLPTFHNLAKVVIRGYPNEFKGSDYDYHRDWACTPQGTVERCVLKHSP